MGTADLKPVRRDRAGGVVSSTGGAWLGRSLAFDPLAAAMPQIVWNARPDGWTISFNRRRGTSTRGSPTPRARAGAGRRPSIPTTCRRARRVGWGPSPASRPTRSNIASGAPTAPTDGSSGRGLPVLDESGEVVEWFGTCTDIDDQKRSQEELRRLRQDLEARVDAAAPPSWTPPSPASGPRCWSAAARRPPSPRARTDSGRTSRRPPSGWSSPRPRPAASRSTAACARCSGIPPTKSWG